MLRLASVAAMLVALTGVAPAAAQAQPKCPKCKWGEICHGNPTGKITCEKSTFKKILNHQCTSFLPHDPSLKTMAAAEAKCRRTPGCGGVSDLYCNGIHPSIPDHYALCRGNSLKTDRYGTCVFSRSDGACTIHTTHVDAGYSDQYKGWYDLQGCGKCYSYCRWVGNSGPGGDPNTRTTYMRKGATSKSFWSCVTTKNGFNTHKSFNYKKCSGKGAPAPPAPPTVGIQYLGCFKNEGKDRVNGHLPQKSWAECDAIAVETGVTTFGLEYPTGAKVVGESYCLMMDGAPTMKRAADKDCEDEGLDSGGHRLGGPNRLAVYSKPREYRYLGCYINKGKDRVGGHVADTNFGECNALALKKHLPVFGMECPQCSKAPGDAYCLMLAGHPAMKRTTDKECEVEGLHNGHRLGGAYRVAV